MTSTIKSRKFIVQAKASDGTTVDVELPEIQQAVGGNVKVSTEGGGTSKLVYEGAVPLVFGFQAARLYYDQGRYTAFKPLAPGETALEAGTRAAAQAEYPRVGESLRAPRRMTSENDVGERAERLAARTRFESWGLLYGDRIE